MNSRNTRENGDVVAWTAIVIAVLAMIFSWAAFNRSGTDVSQIVQEEVNDALVDFETRYEQLENDVRQTTSENLEKAAEDVSTDEAPNTVGE